MSKTIEISRELLQYALNAVQYLAMRADDVGTSNVWVAEEIQSLLAAPVVERQDVLPCDVRVAPATTIKKGCKIETLMQCIELRKDQPDKFTRFENSGPPAPVAVPDGWKLVPIELTDEMIEAGINAPLADTGDDEVDQPQDYRNVWAAMLDAVCLDKVKELNR